MNPTLSAESTARPAHPPGSGAPSQPMLAELLALHESMIMQLRLECLERAGAGDFLPGMILQHEWAAARLRTELARHDTRMSAEVSPVVPGTFPPLPIPARPAL